MHNILYDTDFNQPFKLKIAVIPHLDKKESFHDYTEEEVSYQPTN